MKITDVRVHVLRSPLEQPFAFSQGWVGSRGATMVEVITDEGIVGWGEALCQGLQPPEIAAAAIQHALEPLVIGCGSAGTRGALAPHVSPHARLWAERRVIGAISALDIAFWDIAGKARGEPVARLLGGMFRKRVQAYATGFYSVKGRAKPRGSPRKPSGMSPAGFGAYKVKLGFGIDDDLAVMRAISEAAGKHEAMIDTNHAYGVAEAIRLGASLEDMGWRLRWYEEPVMQENLDGYAEVRRALTTPIAGGENEYTAFGFRKSISLRAPSTSRSPTCASPAASPPVATSSRSPTRTACR